MTIVGASAVAAGTDGVDETIVAAALALWPGVEDSAWGAGSWVRIAAAWPVASTRRAALTDVAVVRVWTGDTRAAPAAGPPSPTTSTVSEAPGLAMAMEN